MSQQIIFSQCLVGHEEISMNAELVAVFLELANNPMAFTGMTQHLSNHLPDFKGLFHIA